MEVFNHVSSLFGVFTIKSCSFLQLWDLASGQVTKTLEGHEECVKCVTFSPNGSQLASASDDETIKVI